MIAAMGVFVQKVALDFGESSVRVYVKDTKEYTQELHSTLFMSFISSQFKLGDKRKKRRLFSSVIDHGIIQDAELLSSYLQFILARAGLGKFALARIELLLAVPTATTSTTKQIWSTVCERIGVSKVTFVSSSLAGAIGAGFSFPIPTVALLIHFGESSSEIAAVSLTQCLFSHPLSLTTTNLAERIRSKFFVSAHHELADSEWKNIESSIGAMLIQEAPVRNQSIPEKSRRLESIATDIVLEMGEELVCDVETALEKLSVEELSLCSSQGIVLIGSICSQEGVAQFLAKKLSIPVYSSGDPEMAVVQGQASLLDFLEREENV